MTTYYVDPAGGNDGNTGLSFAQRIASLAPLATAPLAPGDEVRLIETPPVSLGVGLTILQDAPNGTLSAALTQTLLLGNEVMVPSANVTAANVPLRQAAGINLTSELTVGSAFTTGKIAYYDLGSSQNLSSYDSISLFFETSLDAPAGRFEIRLCSDAIGNTAVNTFALPFTEGNQWAKLTLPNGGALGNSIRSIAIYAPADPGAVFVRLCDLIACNEAELHLQSLVGFNDGRWYTIAGIDGTALWLRANDLDNSQQWYVDDFFESVGAYIGADATAQTLWALSPLDIGAAIDAGNWNLGSIVGTDISRIAFGGGWASADMAARTGLTALTHYYAYLTSSGAPAFVLGVPAEPDNAYYDISYLGVVDMRFHTGSDVSFKNGLLLTIWFAFVDELDPAGPLVLDTVWGSAAARVQPANEGFFTPYAVEGRNLDFGGCVDPIFEAPTTYMLFLEDCLFRNIGNPSQLGSGSVLKRVTFTNCGLGFSGGAVTATGSYLEEVDIINSFSVGAALTGRCLLRDCSILGAKLAALVVSETNAQCVLENFTYDAPTLVDSVQSFQDYPQVIESRIGGDYLANVQHHWAGYHESVADANRHTLSGVAWKISPDRTIENGAGDFATNAPTEAHPGKFRLGAIAVAADVAKTFTLWAKRDHTAVHLKLVCPGMQVPGAPSDVEDALTAAVDTWEQLSISITPTGPGVVELWVYYWSDSAGHAAWVDDFAVA